MNMPDAPLLTDQGAAALALAAEFEDPGSLACAARLRRHFDPLLAAAASSQVVLRRKATAKLGAAASDMYFTPDGLEQATRATVADWRAQRFVANGVQRVIDLGCGIGADLRAFGSAGLTAIGVEIDPLTAAYAQANAPDAQVICGDAVAELPALLADAAESTAIFIDPARRGAHGRTWEVTNFVPAWDFVLGLFDLGHSVCVKLGPGLPRELIPEGVEVTWVSERGDVVEASLWQLPNSRATESAVLLPGPQVLVSSHRVPAVGEPRRFIHEPDGAVIRSRAVGDVHLDAQLLAAGVAYLTTDEAIDSPFVSSFEVIGAMPFDESALRAWVKANDIGTLEIKKRAVDVDPAALRRRLKPKGKNSATLLISPTRDGVKAFVVQRVAGVGSALIRQN